jgi:integrase
MKLLTALRAKLRMGHYSLRTEEAYAHWVRRFVRYHRYRHPRDLSVIEVAEFLRFLAQDKQAAAATQTQALSALLFLYREVIGRPLALRGAVLRARTPTRIPAVLSRPEVERVLTHLAGVYRLVGLLLYGSGMRLTECLSLRVKDLDLARGEIRIRRAKGAKDRVTVLPETLKEPLARHLQRRKAQHAEDLARGGGRVALPSVRSQSAVGGGRVDLAMGLPRQQKLRGPGDGGAAQAPSAPIGDAAGDGRRGAQGRRGQTGELPHAAALLRHPLARGRI